MARRLIVLIIGAAALLLGAPAAASAAPDLQARITGPDPVVAGTNATFVLTVSNIGDATADNVTVTSPVPANTTFVSWTAQSPGWGPTTTPPVGGTSPQISTTKPALAPGASEQFNLVVKVNPGAASGDDASASMHVSSSPPDTNSANNDATAASNVIVRPDLSVTVSAPNTIPPSGSMTVNYTVTNNGPSNASDVALTADVPEGTTFVSFTQQTGPSFTISSNGANRHTATISALAAGATATFRQQLTAKPTLPDPSDITSFARVSTSNQDPNLANDSASAVTTEGTKADLVVTDMPTPTSAAPGGQVTYLVTVANRGVDAHSVSLTDSLPPGSAFVSATQLDGPAFSCTTPPLAAAGDVSCTLATLPARMSAAFSVVARMPLNAPRPSTIDSTATATSATTDANPADNSATAHVGITPPRGVDLVLKGSHSPSRPRRRRIITLIYKIGNTGDVPATGVRFTAALPRRFHFAGAFGAGRLCTIRKRTITCTIARLAAGARVRVTVTGTWSKPGTLAVSGRVTCAQPDLNRKDNAATIRIRVRR
jgi:uncharacterized repeat protein (TIGR01451 family)